MKINELQVNETFKIIKINDDKLRKNLEKKHLSNIKMLIASFNKKTVLIIDEFDREFILSIKDINNIEVEKINSHNQNQLETVTEEKVKKSVIYPNLKLHKIAEEKTEEKYQKKVQLEENKEIQQDYSAIESNIEYMLSSTNELNIDDDNNTENQETEIVEQTFQDSDQGLVQDKFQDNIEEDKELQQDSENAENSADSTLNSTNELNIDDDNNTENQETEIVEENAILENQDNVQTDEVIEEIEVDSNSDNIVAEEDKETEVLTDSIAENQPIIEKEISTIKDAAIPAQHIVIKKEASKTSFLVLVIGVLLGVLSVIVFLSKDALISYFKPLQLNLKTDVAEIEYASSFIPIEYVEDAKNGELVLPEIDTKQLGTFELEYSIKNKLDKITKKLYLKIVDTIAPEITFLQNDVYNDEFYKGCKAYIEKAYDNVDGDVKDLVNCYEEDKQIFYTYTDSSNNTTTKTINFNEIPKCETHSIWNGANCVATQPQVIEKPVYIEKVVEVPSNNSNNQSNQEGTTYESGWIYETIEGIDDSGNAIVKWE